MSLPAVIESPPQEALPGHDPSPEASVHAKPEQKRSPIGWLLGGIGWLISGTFNVASLIACLTALAAIPVLQLIAFGYLLDVSGRLASGSKLRDSLPKLREAGQIGRVVLAVVLAAVPVQLFAHLESVSVLVNPGAIQATVLRFLSIAMAAFGMWYVLWAVARGARWRDFLWPQPIGALFRAWRPSTYSELPDRLWEFTKSLELGRFFWLGFRGLVGTLIWLIPGMIIIATNRNGETGAAGFYGVCAFVALGVVMLYLPMLQAHFAAENRFAALFDVRRIRRLFCFAPWSWLLALVFGLVLLPIPLYLLKIEATPREVAWLPTLVCISFLLPARMIEGLAMRRARRIADQHYSGGEVKPEGEWAFASRAAARALMPIVILIYLGFVTASQYTSWDGLSTWVQQHAVLIPIPFVNGV